MSTPSAMPFYRSLRKGIREIRLLTIEGWENSSSQIACQLHHFELAHAPNYEALSYCWEDASVTREIFVDGHPFQVTTNLYAALKRLAERAKSKFLWIDAICINQSSIDEKNHQVPLMSALYSQADRVLVWLGEEADNSSLAIAFLQRWADACGEARKASKKEFVANPLTFILRYLQDPFDETSWKAAAALVHRPYWKRIWIIQEIVMARDRMIFCGRDEIHFDQFRKAFFFFHGLEDLNIDNQVNPAIASGWISIRPPSKRS